MAGHGATPSQETLKQHNMTEEVFKRLSLEEIKQANTTSVTSYPMFPSNLGPPDPGDPPVALQFESAEHAGIDATLKLYKIDGTALAAKDHILLNLAPFPDGTPLGLRFGRVLAMAGDFFSNRGAYTRYFMTNFNYNPISGSGTDDEKSMTACKARFSDMCMAISTDFNKSIHGLSPLLDLEEGVIRKIIAGIPDAGGAARAYHNHEGLPGDREFVQATMFTRGAWSGLYAVLAWRNWDHFGEDALTCYTAGHWTALEKARAAYIEPDHKLKEAKLNEAYFAEAAACHYLTDGFSSGHVRAPRKALHNPSFGGVAAGNIASTLFRTDFNVWDNALRIMHDDDSSTGLVVKNKLGDLWTAFGDKQFFMPANAVNRARCIQAVQESIDELFKVGFTSYEKGGDLSKLVPARDFKALSLCPQPIQDYIDSTTDENSIDNITALWKPTKDEVDMTQSYQTRIDPGNHSSSFMKNGRPDSSRIVWENDECAAITNNTFRGEDQFPRTVSISTGTTGVLQAMQLTNNPGSKDSSTSLKLNAYGTVSFDAPNLPTMASILSLRNQSKSYPLTHKSATSTSRLLHACTYVHSTSADSYFFTIVAEDGSSASKCSVKMSAWKLKDKMTSSDGTFFDMSSERQEMIQITQVLDSIELTKVNTERLRIFVQAIGKDVSPAVIVVQEYRSTESGSRGKIVVDIAKVDITSIPLKVKNQSQFSFWCKEQALDIKLVELMNGEVQIVVPFESTGQAGPDSDKSLDCYVIALTSQSSSKERTEEPKVVSTRGGRMSKDVTFLKGLVTSSDSEDLIVVEHEQYPAYQFQYTSILKATPIRGRLGMKEAPPALSPTAKIHKCTASEKELVLIQPYIDAVYPVSSSSQAFEAPTAPSTLTGHSIFNINLMKSANPDILAGTKIHAAATGAINKDEEAVEEEIRTPYRILIQVHTPVPSPPTTNKSSTPTQWKCTTSSIPDSLVSSSRIESGYFYSLKWLPFEDPLGGGSPGLLQIFSWYGCLGFRTFGVRAPLPVDVTPGNQLLPNSITTTNATNKVGEIGEGAKYILTGIQCYNGQTSKDLGCGIEGMFGMGFSTINTRSWTDVKEWFPRVQLPFSSSSHSSSSSPSSFEDWTLIADEDESSLTTNLPEGGWSHTYPNAAEMTGKIFESDMPITKTPSNEDSGSSTSPSTERHRNQNTESQHNPTIVYGMEKFWRWGDSNRWWRS